MKHKTIFKSDDHRKRVLNKYDITLAQLKGNIKQQKVYTSFGETSVLSYGNDEYPKLILLHGANSNASSWVKDICFYGKRYKVYAIDIIGEPGKSEPKRLPYEDDSYSDWLNEVFEQLQIEKLHLLGLSQGGWLAVRFAVKFPEKIDRLVLLSPAGIVNTTKSFIFKAVLFSFLGSFGKRKINNLILGNQKVDQQVLDFMDLMQSSVNARMEKEYIFSDEELKNMTMPTLFIGGAHDVIRDSGKIKDRLQALLPDFEFYIDPEKGHILLDLADRINVFLMKEKAV
ncbi:alpha/beta hydrolase [Chryseobacterium sp. Tr-659]|uniref:alpha/beta fold hydrolase n=1 Tax=Chryseobacterium sp. Tr-659 TaxID=2608340 RepID=UPI001423A73C|nr:alpha/beta hydrolase [Chryseobacterium sp. Tr-659]NIF06493.1 alpha/beta hydrolase [Chryseobacterium sp. Tr-659]